VLFVSSDATKLLKERDRLPRRTFFVVWWPRRGVVRRGKSISTDELWALHEKIASILFAKMDAEKLKLENRLEQIIKGKTSGEATGRRPYPKVYPRFQNLDPPHQTWSCRGLQPRWIREMLSGGKSLQDLRIRHGAPDPEQLAPVRERATG
jgi:DNA-binding protein H-NS